MILTTFIAILLYLGLIVFFVGTGFKIYQYAITPAPLKVPTMPAPLDRKGVALRIFEEVVVFKSLFRSNKWIWLFGWMFHVSLLLVTIRHLRYFIEPVPYLVVLAQPFGKYAGITMIIGLLGLLARRLFVERIKYISSLSDYLMLGLLILIGLSGLMISFVVHTDIVQFKSFMLGVLTLNWSHLKPIPADFILVVHLLLVISLMIIFPFSKLLHAPGVFFSPSRNQVDNSRDKRHLAPWAAKLENTGN